MLLYPQVGNLEKGPAYGYGYGYGYYQNMYYRGENVDHQSTKTKVWIVTVLIMFLCSLVMC